MQNLSGIGNALMTTPLLAELRRLYPQSRIDFLTTPNSASLLGTNPHVNEVLVERYMPPRRRRDYVRMVRQLRERRYDVCFITITAVDYAYSVRPVVARIPTTVIHDYALRDNNRFTVVFSHRVPFDQARHDVESNLDLLRALVPETPVQAGPLELRVPEVEVREARRLLREARWQEGEPTVALCPGSTPRWKDKRWPKEHYTDLVRRLRVNRPNLNVVIFCGPDEAEEVSYFRENPDSGPAIVMENLPLMTYAGAVSLCDVAVSGDSLPVHMCAALQVPLVALFGPTDPRRTGPWKSPARVLVPNCDWIPYYRMPYPPDPSQFEPCMPRLAVSTVQEAVEDLLQDPTQVQQAAKPSGA